MTNRKPTTPLPPDAVAQVASLPDWLRDVAAEGFAAVDEAGARKVVQEARDAEHARRRQVLEDTAKEALAKKWGKETFDVATRLLGSVEVRQAETAILISIEAAVVAEQRARRERRRVEKFGRGAK